MPKNTPIVPRFLVTLSGGCVQSVTCNVPAACQLHDLDNEDPRPGGFPVEVSGDSPARAVARVSLSVSDLRNLLRQAENLADERGHHFGTEKWENTVAFFDAPVSGTYSDGALHVQSHYFCKDFTAANSAKR